MLLISFNKVFLYKYLWKGKLVINWIEFACQIHVLIMNYFILFQLKDLGNQHFSVLVRAAEKLNAKGSSQFIVTIVKETDIFKNIIRKKIKWRMLELKNWQIINKLEN